MSAPGVAGTMRRLGGVLAVLLALTGGAAAADGLVTQPSTHDVDGTISRFETAVRAAGWVVFGQIDHAAAAKAVGLKLDRRTVVLFGNPRTGTAALQAHPTLALDLPMRVLVWQDAAGKVSLTRSTGADLATRVFARHGVMLPDGVPAKMDEVVAGFARAATE